MCGRPRFRRRERMGRRRGGRGRIRGNWRRSRSRSRRRRNRQRKQLRRRGRPRPHLLGRDGQHWRVHHAHPTDPTTPHSGPKRDHLGIRLGPEQPLKLDFAVRRNVRHVPDHVRSAVEGRGRLPLLALGGRKERREPFARGCVARELLAVLEWDEFFK